MPPESSISVKALLTSLSNEARVSAAAVLGRHLLGQQLKQAGSSDEQIKERMSLLTRRLQESETAADDLKDASLVRSASRALVRLGADETYKDEVERALQVPTSTRPLGAGIEAAAAAVGIGFAIALVLLVAKLRTGTSSGEKDIIVEAGVPEGFIQIAEIIRNSLVDVFGRGIAPPSSSPKRKPRRKIENESEITKENSDIGGSTDKIEDTLPQTERDSATQAEFIGTHHLEAPVDLKNATPISTPPREGSPTAGRALVRIEDPLTRIKKIINPARYPAPRQHIARAVSYEQALELQQSLWEYTNQNPKDLPLNSKSDAIWDRESLIR